MATYTIDSEQDLIDFTLLSGKFAGVLWKDNLFNLTADLDLTGVDPVGDGKGWWPIGDWDMGDWFNGFFDGQGHTISNMIINRPTRDHAGLFGAIDSVSGAGVDTFDDANVTDSGGKVKINQVGKFNSSRVGMKVDVNWHNIFYDDGWYDILEVDASENYIVIDLAYVANIAFGIDGIVGQNSTLTDNPIKNLGLVNIDVTGADSTGGMIGSCLGFGILANFPVRNCYVTGTINATRRAGGFIGTVNNGYFLNCYADVDIIVTSTNGYCSLGSFVGSDSVNLDCVNCYGIGLLTHVGINNHSTYIGGLCGKVDYDVVDYNGDCAVTEGSGSKVLITKAGVFDEATAGMTATIEWGVEAGSGDYTDGWFNILASDDNDSILVDLAYVSDIASDVDVDVEDASAVDYSTDSFWDKTTTGLDVDGRGDGDATGKLTAEMKQQATFTNWDFDNIWWITEDSTYPELSVFEANPNLPTKASNESPADDTMDVDINATLSWLKDSGDNVLVYFDKKNENDPPITKVIDDQEVIVYDPPGDLDCNTIYVWRVDTKNENGTTTGDPWEFTTTTFTVLKKGNVLGAEQINNLQMIGISEDLGSVCPSGLDCKKDCNVINVTNDYHPGINDSIINF